jgi:hypothetical protein
LQEEWYPEHQKAVLEGQETYQDPGTIYQVFTKLAHENRGQCCDTNCRHCAYTPKTLLNHEPLWTKFKSLVDESIDKLSAI